MPRWIEIPAKRILEVPRHIFLEEYRRVGPDGEDCPAFMKAYRIVRRSDHKVFKPAEFMPAEGLALDVCYLEEI